MLIPEVVYILFLISLTLQASNNGKSKKDCTTVSLENANKRFRECCKMSTPPACWDACKYDLKLGEARTTFMGDNDCGKSGIKPVLACANGGDRGSDNRQCCMDSGVYNEPGDICERFCGKSSRIGNLTAADKRCGLKLRLILHCHQCGLKP